MKKVLIIGHATEFARMVTTLIEKMPDAEIILHEEAEQRGITINKVFEPEPIKFKISNLELTAKPFISKKSSSSKYNGEKITTQRSERRKKNRDARKSRRQL